MSHVERLLKLADEAERSATVSRKEAQRLCIHETTVNYTRRINDEYDAYGVWQTSHTCTTCGKHWEGETYRDRG